jgi:pyridoxamine 5'-phosphate oxidase
MPETDQADPFTLFDAWFTEAKRTEVNDPNAMTLATCTADAVPSARIVLLKAHNTQGFVFYTNSLSRKGAELAANARAALLFHWKVLQRQIRIEGAVQQVTDAEADAYFATRPRLSRIAAWASLQSQPLPARAVFEQRIAEAELEFPGDDVPRPPHWFGYRVVPARFEFWQEMPFRMHDRSIYAREGSGWAISKLFP